MPRRLWIPRPVLALVTLCAFTGTAAASSLSVLHADDDWAALRRPFHLPKLAAGAVCPVSRVDRRIDWNRAHIFGRSGIGLGPVYAGLGFQNGRLHATSDVQYSGPWYGEKVFWYVLPRYRGPILIRGRRLDGPQQLGLNGSKTPRSELRIQPGETVSWQGRLPGSRGVPSEVRVRAAGCYGVQIDGTNFSRAIIFKATLAR
jgi:hypothetical protein